MVKYWYLSFHIFFLSMLYPKEINIESIEIDSKSNGIIVNVTMDSILRKNDLTAWQANSGWFYITLYKAKGDTLNLKSNGLPSEVIDYQLIQGDESFQIGLRLRRNIESHEFSFIDKNTLNIPLRYSTEYFSSLDSVTKPHSQQQNAGIPNGIKKWLYLTGSGVAISGSAKGGRLSSDTQTQIGIAMILATFIIDILWKIA
tara:strand:+ start:849 stop:1451 length:603 start_codon:yes stop_codon:yes gene_type:complete